MSVVTYSYARQNLAKLMDEVERDNAPVYISRQRKEGAAVLMSLKDYEALETTLYLLSNPNNAANLRKAKADLDKGKGIEFDPTAAKKPGRRK
ncbi:MAG TPA: type II toxin-antitoxin system prevent-host-death family antitoxin [Rhizomicrobium sp.]|jgi:antitoxin YefM|nr:type II toxin-antitoxin system prevent-host-death family antitoxin [Rhizomicrobium sp.]